MRRLRNIAVLAAWVFVGIAAAQGTFSGLAARGEAALARGQAREALRLGEAAAAQEPKRFEAHRLVARAALALDRPDRAEAAFRTALRLAPPAARPNLQNGLRAAATLRKGLQETARARALKASGDLAAAAKAQEAAYRLLPARYALGIAAAELFESAGRLDDARRVLEEVRRRNPKGSAATALPQRLAVLDRKIEARGRQAATDAARKATEDARHAEAERIEARRLESRRIEERRIEDARRAEAEARRAQEAELRRADEAREAARRAEEERQRVERARLDREETERLTAILNEGRRAVGDAESAIAQADDRVGDFERAVRKFDGQADDARERRDRTKRERDELEDKLRDAKGDLSRQLLRDELRTAEAKYDDAKGDYNRAKDRLDDAKASLSQWREAADEARRKLERARQDVRDAEAALARVGG